MRTIVVVGTMGSDPYAGMAWMHMQIVAGLRRLGHDAYYFETTSAWPYDPTRCARVRDSDYTIPYLKKVTESFGLGDYWAYRHSYTDKSWVNLSRRRGEDLLAHADAVFNVAGATRFAEEYLDVGRLIYFGTDPVTHEIQYLNGQEDIVNLVDEHDEFVTYGENIGNPDCPLPPFENLRARTRQPILLDLWQGDRLTGRFYNTVCNWRQTGKDIRFNGEIYHWSKHHEFLKFLNLPTRIGRPIELAMGLSNITNEDQAILKAAGWQLVDAHAFTTEPWAYRDYVRRSRAEFTVAKDQNVRLRSGWFSERSACYLAAGRPVITQDTGFGVSLPTGRGLFAFNTMDEILAAHNAIESNYQRHSRAAQEIAEEYFCAKKVLAKLLDDLGL